MGYVFDYKDAVAYDQLFSKPSNKDISDLEKRLILDMLKPVPGSSLLEIGCGTGISLSHFVQSGLDVTGIDPSPYVLDLAAKKLGHRVELYRGVAEDLPFEDNSFTYACLISTLEFVEDPRKAIEEACRVAKDRVFLGIMNRHAIRAVQLRLEGVFSETLYKHATFFSIWELKQIIRSILGNVPVTWRTASHLAGVSGKIIHRIEQINLFQKYPFGAFAGIVVAPVPRFRTRPLSLPYPAKHTSGVVAG
ncbi:MAG: class I SAM-dependent methyltransferase [Desulfobacterales bacterium]|nr:class I SAM-dependent methyltransferase [Desulfobacterales bacterium]